MINVFRFRRRRRSRCPPALLLIGLVCASCIALAPQQFPQGADPVQKSTSSIIRNGGDVWKGRAVASNDATPSAPGARLIDQVTRVRDGDTIVVGLVPIRIANLDCAERGSAAGDRATRRAKELVAGQTLTCRLEGGRSYDREVGTCELSGGRDFGEVLIAEGWCARWRG